MLDEHAAWLTKFGTVTVQANGTVLVEGFDGEGTSCRDVAVLAQVWAIQMIANSLRGDLQEPGGGSSAVD